MDVCCFGKERTTWLDHYYYCADCRHFLCQRGRTWSRQTNCCLEMKRRSYHQWMIRSLVDWIRMDWLDSHYCSKSSNLLQSGMTKRSCQPLPMNIAFCYYPYNYGREELSLQTGKHQKMVLPHFHRSWMIQMGWMEAYHCVRMG